MGVLANFKMPKIDIPKIDKSILPDASDMGFNTGAINSQIDELKSNFKTDGLDFSKMENPKDKALEVIKAVPKIGNFSLMSVVPTDMLDKLDTESITKNINSSLSLIDLDGMGTLQLPSDVGTMAKDVINGKGIDFQSLYKMPVNNPFDTSQYSLGSDFDINEMMNEANALSDAATGEFNIDEYLDEFSDIGL